MLIRDLIDVYIAKKQETTAYGQVRTTYKTAVKYTANVQYMTNEQEQRSFGEVTNQVIILRFSHEVLANIGDGIYLKAPKLGESGELEKPQYIILSVKTAYIGVNLPMNPCSIIAKKVQ